jgi:hypothetical protein
MWFNESAPHIKSDMFVVQAMPGVSGDIDIGTLIVTVAS